MSARDGLRRAYERDFCGCGECGPTFEQLLDGYADEILLNVRARILAEAQDNCMNSQDWDNGMYHAADIARPDPAEQGG